jgi:hypothetical protein
MGVRKVSLNHPQFDSDKEMGFLGVGYLKNDGTPVDVDEDEFKRVTGVSLEEAYAGSAVIQIDGKSIPAANPAPSQEDETTLSEPLSSADLGLSDEHEGGE